MKASLQIAVAFALSIAGVHAIPSPEISVGDVHDGMTVAKIDHKDGMTFTTYDLPVDVSADVNADDDEVEGTLSRRGYCSGDKLNCNGSANVFTSHTAAKATCDILVRSLEAFPVDDSPRAYCLNSSGDRCCISWHSVPPSGTVYSHFKEAAQDILDVCGDNAAGKVSGQHTKANINGKCVKVCLSNRPKGC